MNTKQHRYDWMLPSNREQAAGTTIAIPWSNKIDKILSNTQQYVTSIQRSGPLL